jgi:hypothetical protein
MRRQFKGMKFGWKAVENSTVRSLFLRRLLQAQRQENVDENSHIDIRLRGCALVITFPAQLPARVFACVAAFAAERFFVVI